MEIAKRVNYTLLLYVDKCAPRDVESNIPPFIYVTTTDFVPQDYVVYKNMANCSSTLYMWHWFVIYSITLVKLKFPIEDMWKALDIKVWYLIMITISILVLLHMLRERSRSLILLFNTLLNYAKCIVGLAEMYHPKNYLYYAWLSVSFPIFLILTNDLLANMLSSDEYFVDDLDDLLQDHITVVTDHFTARK